MGIGIWNKAHGSVSAFMIMGHAYKKKMRTEKKILVGKSVMCLIKIGGAVLVKTMK